MTTDAPAFATLARAKVNLTLHVLGRRPDGYHTLDTLAAFPEIGDRLEVEPSSVLSLTLDGPFGAALDAGGDNLVTRAASALAEAAAARGRPVAGAALRLDKRLPPASGIGGGSSDAAATLRSLDALWALETDAATLDRIALSLGADVPMCLRQPTPVRATGIGETIAPAPPLPSAALALVNPGRPVPTARVFAGLAASAAGPYGAPSPAAPDAGWRTVEALADWLDAARNDLAAPAEAIVPEIGAALAALAAQPGCRFARMSGSGATCFGLFATPSEAAAAAAAIAQAEPRWWTAAGPLGSNNGA